MEKMLQGLKVVDLTRNLSGPFCTALLADMGAEVIKIEIPKHGDDTRKAPPFISGESSYFLSVNRGKKSVMLNLKTEEGKKILWELIKGGDILVENNRPGTMERLGLGYSDVANINSGIIYASISGFGQDGPLKEKGAYDMVIQGYGGIMSITGIPGGEPIRVGYSIADLAAGLYAVIGILGALNVRNITGRGQHLDISMMDCQVALMENAIVRYTSTGELPQPLGNRHPSFAPFQAYRADDGYFTLSVANNEQFRLFCAAIDRETIAEDPRFSTNEDRVRNIKELNSILESIFLNNSKGFWVDTLEQYGIPSSPINNVREVVENPQTKARGMVVELEHPVAGKIQIANCPIKASETPAMISAPAPLLGQHTELILSELGFSLEEIKDMQKKGIC